MKIFSTLTFCLLLTAAFAHADLMDGLVLYMPLDEGSGSVTQDFSPNGFEGEVMAAQHGLTVNSARHSNLGRLQITSLLKTTLLSISKARLHRRHGCNWIDSQTHTLLSSGPGRAVQLGISGSGSV